MTDFKFKKAKEMRVVKEKTYKSDMDKCIDLMDCVMNNESNGKDTTISRELNQIIEQNSKEKNTNKKISNVKYCDNPKCKNCEKIIIYEESIYVCPNCGESESILVTCVTPQQWDEYPKKPSACYKRVNHCVDKINKVLCRGNIIIPDSVFEKIDEEIERANMNKKTVSVDWIRKVLKRNKLSKYYDYRIYIHCKVTGEEMPVIERKDYEKIIKYFTQINEIYNENYKSRNNFLSYELVIHTILLRMGRNKLSKYFKLLKSDVKQRQQERILNEILQIL